MNHRDRDILDKHGELLAGLRLSCDENAKSAESILTNHLPSMKEKIDIIFRVVAWGLTVLGIMIAGFGILVVVVVQ